MYHGPRNRLQIAPANANRCQNIHLSIHGKAERH